MGGAQNVGPVTEEVGLGMSNTSRLLRMEGSAVAAVAANP